MDTARHVMAFLIVIGFLAIVGAWFVFPLKGDPQIFNVMLGILGSGGFMAVVNFYFGSSAGSKQKDDALIAKLNGQKEIPTVTEKTQ